MSVSKFQVADFKFHSSQVKKIFFFGDSLACRNLLKEFEDNSDSLTDELET